MLSTKQERSLFESTFNCCLHLRDYAWVRMYCFLLGHRKLTCCISNREAGAVPLSPSSGEKTGSAGGPCRGGGPTVWAITFYWLCSREQHLGIHSVPITFHRHAHNISELHEYESRFLTECPNWWISHYLLYLNLYILTSDNSQIGDWTEH